MDILSHGLWGAVISAAAGNKKGPTGKPEPRLKPLLGFFWGIFPDLISFAPVTIIFLYGGVFGGLDLTHLPRPEHVVNLVPQLPVIYWLTLAIYNLSHSAIIFLAAFLGTWLVRYYHHRHSGRRLALGSAPVWEMSAWLFHIILDIPTHSNEFFPTPFLWPATNVHFDGLPWSQTPWVMVLNFCALGASYLMLRRSKRKLAMAKS